MTKEQKEIRDFFTVSFARYLFYLGSAILAIILAVFAVKILLAL